MNRIAASVLSVALTAVLSWPGESRSQEPNRPLPAADTVLRIARSTDGVTFLDSGQLLARSATAPDIEVLPGGEIIVVFDQACEGISNATRMMVSRSPDGGWSWSSPRRLHVRRGNRALRDVRHGDLLLMPDGKLRLYFATTVGGGKGRTGQVLITSAAMRDGWDFALDPATRLRARHDDVHPLVAQRNGHTHLFAVGLAGVGPRKDATASVDHFLSRDGRRFAALRQTGRPPDSFLGSILAAPPGLRLFTSSSKGIVSLVSRDGRTWHPEGGIRHDRGWDPAVTRLPDNTFLMVYCTARNAANVPATTVVEAAVDETTDLDEVAWEELADVEDPAAAEESAMTDPGGGVEAGLDIQGLEEPEIVAADASAGPLEPTDVPSPDDEAPSVDDAQSDETWVQTEETAVSDGTAAKPPGMKQDQERMSLDEWKASAGGFEDWDPAWSDGFCPTPDFMAKIDYLQWYVEYALTQPTDNAYYAYARFLPGPNDPPGSKPEWPELKDMFHDNTYEGPPAPWDPADHPDWNVTEPEVQALLSEYREATRHAGYATPPMMDTNDEGDEATLAEILLPSLSGHRALSKATLADAWRLEDGKVNPKRMLDAWETTLRDATHLSQGATLIEELVSVAIGELTYKTARWALADGVFSSEQLQGALDTLQRSDGTRKDPADALRGEHAFAMDITQHLFSPPRPDGTPMFNAKRLNRIADWFEPQDGLRERIQGMQPEDVFASVDAFDAYYRQLTEMFRIGYPEVRAADADAFTQEAVRATPLTEMFLPNLSRYYQLKTRAEASRRATRLAYATHIYRARTGHWPASLSELSPEFGDRMRTDPFSGGYFGYRLTDAGPVIYSLSENGIDDGGVHSPRWDDEITNEAGSDDHVFWPPQDE